MGVNPTFCNFTIGKEFKEFSDDYSLILLILLDTFSWIWHKNQCGVHVAVDLNTPCELDNVFQQKLKTEVKAKAQLQSMRNF